MNHFFLPIHYRYRSQKAIRALRVFQEKRKVSFCQVKRNKVKVRDSHTCLLEIPGFARNDRMLFCPQKLLKNGNV